MLDVVRIKREGNVLIPFYKIIMKKQNILSLFIISLNINSISYASNSLKFEENIQKTCGIIFDNQIGITFKDEKPKSSSSIILYSNDAKSNDLKLKISKILKANNLSKTSNSDIFLILNKTKKVSLSTLEQNTISLKKGKHYIALYVDQYRGLTDSGTASLEFQLQAVCK